MILRLAFPYGERNSKPKAMRLCCAALVAINLLFVAAESSRAQVPDAPKPPGTLVDIGGQRLHLNCAGRGSPTVLLESGTGDVSVIWSLVQPAVSAFARVCSYDRGGYAWSDPGNRPRTFSQLALELHTALERLHVGPPYVLVGQSYGGLVIRGFFARYPSEVTGMVMVDAVHEDQRVVYGGQPHRIRDSAQGRQAPAPQVRLDAEMIKLAHDRPPLPETALEAPLDRLPMSAQRVWRWANTKPLLGLAQEAELDWSPEELARMHSARLSNRASLGDLPLVVLARTHGGYANGMRISAADLERERRDLQADLARLSRKGKLIFAAHSGHNIHLEDPDLVVSAIGEIVRLARSTTIRKQRWRGLNDSPAVLPRSVQSDPAFVSLKDRPDFQALFRNQ
jgi:pimeloyl-ACP methyl ester carboxylesterase